MSGINYTIIDEGNDGIIISPSIEGDPNKISKIGLKSKIEYDKSIKLPLSLSDYLYLNPEEYEYREISHEEYKKITGKNTKKSFGSLTMKKIEGETLFDFLENTYATVESWTNEYHHRYKQNYIIMSLNEFKELYTRLLIFKDLCKRMNSEGIYHNDIVSKNIMITSDKRLFLIDFYSVTFDSPLYIPHLKINKNDMDSINILFKEIIDIGLFNPEIYDYCISKSIIEPFEIQYEVYSSSDIYEKIALQIINKKNIFEREEQEKLINYLTELEEKGKNNTSYFYNDSDIGFYLNILNIYDFNITNIPIFKHTNGSNMLQFPIYQDKKSNVKNISILVKHMKNLEVPFYIYETTLMDDDMNHSIVISFRRDDKLIEIFDSNFKFDEEYDNTQFNNLILHLKRSFPDFRILEQHELYTKDIVYNNYGFNSLGIFLDKTNTKGKCMYWSYLIKRLSYMFPSMKISKILEIIFIKLGNDKPKDYEKDYEILLDIITGVFIDSFNRLNILCSNILPSSIRNRDRLFDKKSFYGNSSIGTLLDVYDYLFDSIIDRLKIN